MLTTMRRRFTAVFAVFAVVVAMSAVNAPSRALAGGGDCAGGHWAYDQFNNKYCDVSSPGSPGSPGDPGNGVNIQCTNNHITYEGQDYVCDLADGWSFSYGCYIKEMSPQPPAGDPMWGTADPSVTRMQYVSCGVMPPTVPGNRLPVAGPCVGTCGGINPVQAVTAQLAIDKPSLGMSPPGTAPGGPTATGFVNQNIWFWTYGAKPGTPLDTSTMSAQAGGVVGVRSFGHIDWAISRAGAGTVATLHCVTDDEYTPDKGSAPSPDPNCGYQFKDPGAYTITVTTTWTLVVTQNGLAGQPQTVTSAPNTTTITINEGQSTNG
jgi:hypothetical protein